MGAVYAPPAAHPTLTRRLARGLAGWPRLRVSGLLAAPLGWLVVFYLGSLAVLLAAAFWHSDSNLAVTVTNTCRLAKSVTAISYASVRSFAAATNLLAAFLQSSRQITCARVLTRQESW